MLKENEKKLIAIGQNVTDEWLDQQIDWCIYQIKKNMERYETHFPSASATEGRYRIKENDDWTNGFWTGMLWLAYELTQDKKFMELAKENLLSFQDRLDKHFVLDHHDIGFLYSPSAIAGYQLLGDIQYKNMAIKAADVLLKRHHEKGQFIQAWGQLGDPTEYRLIIDSLINLPLLLRATELTEDTTYRRIAQRHYQTVLRWVIKEDATTFHTYYFDPETGNPLYGATHQGNSDHSIWARGQSWAILGIPLVESYLGGVNYPSNYPEIVDIFIQNLPEDLVPYWDFDYSDKKPSAKDSSALAIAACGLFEADKKKCYPLARDIALGMLYQLGTNYSSKNKQDTEGLLLHGVYAYHEGKGIDEPNLWGDYFFMEALMRAKHQNWKKYW